MLVSIMIPSSKSSYMYKIIHQVRCRVVAASSSLGILDGVVLVERKRDTVHCSMVSR